MNKKFLILIFFVINCAVESAPFPQITMEKLLDQDWTAFGALHTYGMKLAFMKNRTFTEELVGEGCLGYSGTFSFNNNELILIGEKESPCGPDGFIAKRVCKLVSQSADPFYFESLICDGGTYYGSGLKPAGSMIKIQDVDAVIIEPRTAIARANIKIREKPSLSSKSYNCRLESEEFVPFFPKGRELALHARTLKKEKVNGKEAYWYFVRPDLDGYVSCSVDTNYTSLVWIFGGSVD